MIAPGVNPDSAAPLLAEAEACAKPGEIGALLRREGLYSSHFVEWRRARERGDLAATKRRGPAAKVPNPLEKKVRELEREVARATRRAERAEGLVELQEQVSELLGIQLPKPDEDKWISQWNEGIGQGSGSTIGRQLRRSRSYASPSRLGRAHSIPAITSLSRNRDSRLTSGTERRSFTNPP